MSEPKWKKVYSAVNQIEAEIIKGLLESQGLTVFISQDSYQKTMGISGVFGAFVDVLVPNNQKTEAEEILNNMSDYESSTEAE